jgi:flavin-dependent dehydrogenase
MLRVPFATKRNLNHAPGFIAKRLDFDYYLYQKAEANKLIKLYNGTETISFSKTNSGWSVHTHRGVINTRLLIDASGAHSIFSRHQAGIKQEPRYYCAGLRAYYKNVEGLDAEHYIELHFIKKFLPGYFWIFPLPNGLANVGVGLRSDVVSRKRINLKKEMLQIISTHPLISKRFKHAELIDGIKGWGLPLGSIKRKISGDNYILVGDAASLIDPFTGEGIGNAMLSGWVAAQTALLAYNEKNYSADFLKKYDDEVYRRLWQELNLSHRLQQLAAYPALFNWVVNKANKNKTLSEMISCMFEDIDLRSRFRQPSFYFRLLFD